MTEGESSPIGLANVRHTYISLGLAMPGSELLEGDGFSGCLGPFSHPVCNFAAAEALDPWSARRLKEIAASRPAFNVYLMPGADADVRAELLVRQSFRFAFRLVHMVAAPGDPGPIIEPRLASDFESRLQVARYMGSQFLTHQAVALRETIAEATARAEALELYEVRERGEAIGAMMLSRFGGAFGLYNLCVSAKRRGKGLGRGLVAWARAEAALSGDSVTLQCDARLAAWYEHLGFRRESSINVYSWANLQQPDIMN